MPLPTSGEISLNDIHVEAGGVSGTEARLNMYDIRNLIGKATRTESSFSEFYSPAFTATGGTVTNVGGYRIHTFTGSSTFTIVGGGKTVEYLVVAGGGAGGKSFHSGPWEGMGGGGAGGM